MVREPERLIRLLDAGECSDAEVCRIVPTWQRPCYVRSYDPEVGLSSLVCTIVPRFALRLPNGRAAYDLWQSSPTSEPTRPDGRPNQPLRAFSVNFEKYRPDPWLN